jgi:hypothetical protein
MYKIHFEKDIFVKGEGRASTQSLKVPEHGTDAQTGHKESSLSEGTCLLLGQKSWSSTSAPVWRGAATQGQISAAEYMVKDQKRPLPCSRDTYSLHL